MAHAAHVIPRSQRQSVVYPTSRHKCSTWLETIKTTKVVWLAFLPAEMSLAPVTRRGFAFSGTMLRHVVGFASSSQSDMLSSLTLVHLDRVLFNVHARPSGLTCMGEEDISATGKHFCSVLGHYFIQMYRFDPRDDAQGRCYF